MSLNPQETIRVIVAAKRSWQHIECAVFAETIAVEPKYAPAKELLIAAAKIFRKYADEETTEWATDIAKNLSKQ